MTTGSDALLDTTAWWEIIEGSKVGRAIHAKYVEPRTHRLHVSSLTLGEIVMKFGLVGRADAAKEGVRMIQQIATSHPVTVDLAIAGALARADLRKSEKDASFVDGMILATARSLDVILVSNDRAFKKERRIDWPTLTPGKA